MTAPFNKDFVPISTGETNTLADIEKEMKQAARALEFERAAELRDEFSRLKKLLSAGAKK